MQVHILSLHTPSSPGWGQRVKTFFTERTTLHIKLKGMEQRAPRKHIFCPYTHPQAKDRVKRSKHFFLKVVILHIKLNGALSTMQAHILSLHTPSPLGLGQNVKTFFLKTVMLHIKLKGMKHKTPCKQIVCPSTHILGPHGCVKGSKHFFF